MTRTLHAFHASAHVAALLGLIAVTVGPHGCATARSAQRCPESVVARCLTPIVCETDRRRSCEVCRCSDAPYVPIQR